MIVRARRRIAFITDGLLEAYQSELRKAFERAATREGFDMIVVMGRGLGHPDASERAQNAVYDWVTPESVDAVVLLSGVLMNFTGLASIEALVRRLGAALPVVSVGVALPGISSMTVDNRAGMRTAVQHLIRVHGCRRIAYLAGPSDNAETRARLEGYHYALEAHLLAFDPRLVEHGPFTVEGGAAAMQAIIARQPSFDAVVGANDPIAVGARQVLEAAGSGLARRVPLIGFDDSPLAASALLTSVAQPFNQLAVQALEALKNAMDGRSARHVAFTPQLALRDSCGCGHSAQGASLPAIRAGQSLRDYLAANRSPLAETLREASASLDWWSTRLERLIAALEAAAAGQEQEFYAALDRLAEEAFADGVPVAQIARNLARVQQHLGKAPAFAPADPIWSGGLARLTSALGDAARKQRLEQLERQCALRDAALSLWAAGDHDDLGRRLSDELPKLGIRQAYLGALSGSNLGGLEPIVQLGSSGAPLARSESHDTRRLLPSGFPAMEEPSTLLASAVNFGPRVTGVWVCGGSTDVLVFEQLRMQLGAIFEMFALRGGRAP